MKGIHRTRLIRFLQPQAKYYWAEGFLRILNEPAAYQSTDSMPAHLLIRDVLIGLMAKQISDRRLSEYIRHCLAAGIRLGGKTELEHLAPFSIGGLEFLFERLQGHEDSGVRLHHLLTETHQFDVVTNLETTVYYGAVMIPRKRLHNRPWSVYTRDWILSSSRLLEWTT